AVVQQNDFNIGCAWRERVLVQRTGAIGQTPVAAGAANANRFIFYGEYFFFHRSTPKKMNRAERGEFFVRRNSAVVTERAWAVVIARDHEDRNVRLAQALHLLRHEQALGVARVGPVEPIAGVKEQVGA